MVPPSLTLPARRAENESGNGTWIRERKYTRLPGRHVEEQPFALQVVAIPVVRSRRELILEAPFLAGQVREGEPDVALALVGCIVDCDDKALADGALPAEDQKAIVRPVSVPSGRAFEKLPFAVAEGGLPQNGEKPVIERTKILVGWFVGASTEVRRDACVFPLELPLMKE
jgi:hypothetical protein